MHFKLRLDFLLCIYKISTFDFDSLLSRSWNPLDRCTTRTHPWLDAHPDYQMHGG